MKILFWCLMLLVLAVAPCYADDASDIALLKQDVIKAQAALQKRLVNGGDTASLAAAIEKLDTAKGAYRTLLAKKSLEGYIKEH